MTKLLFNPFSLLIMTVFRSSKLLFLDGVGAVVSAVSLGVVLPAIQPWVGLSYEILMFLAVLALILAIFSFGSFAAYSSVWKPRLFQVGVFNLAYCLLTTILIGCYWQEMETLGRIYFPLEIFVVVALACWEIKVSKES